MKSKFTTIGVSIVLISTILIGLMGAVSAVNPGNPGKPTGPIQGSVNASYRFSVGSVTEPGHQISYNFTWGDGHYTVMGPYDSGTPPQVQSTHIYVRTGLFHITVRCMDNHGNLSLVSPPLNFTAKPLERPGVPTGPISGNLGELLTFDELSIKAPFNHSIYYDFAWGDGLSTGWLGPFPSGMSPYSPVEAMHQYDNNGNYSVTVRAKDATTGLISENSAPHNVTIGQTQGGPLFAITGVKGGFGVTAYIQNLLAPSKWVDYTVEISGGQVTGLHVHKFYNGTIYIASGSTVSVSTKAFFAVGNVKISVTAKASGQPLATATYQGFDMFFYVMSLKLM